jgi:hypothetical protein
MCEATFASDLKKNEQDDTVFAREASSFGTLSAGEGGRRQISTEMLEYNSILPPKT